MGQIKFINAGAGSGKTYTLTERFCDYIQQGAHPSEFILTTYTKAAAEEFRTKIKAKLIEKDLKEYLPLVDSAQIGTIHSVAQRYVEKYWYLLKMSPMLALKEENEMKEFIAHLLDSVVSNEDLKFFYKYQNQLNITKSEGNFTYPDPDFWKSIVLKLVENLRLYDMGSDLQVSRDASTEMAEDLFPEYTLNESKLKATAKEFKDYLDSVTTAKKNATEFKAKVVAFVNSEDHSEHLKDILEFKKTKSSAQWKEKAPDGFLDEVTRIFLSSIRELPIECINRIFNIAEKLFECIASEKREKGILEYSDLEILFKKLLEEEIVRDDIQSTIHYVFVDEFQDVSPIQLKIFESLAEIVEHNCWVGDPKQAIYGFRGSDSSLVRSVISSISDVEPLEHSYRSLEQLVTSANAMFIPAFGKLTESERIEKKYVELKPCDKKVKEQNLLEGYRANHHWWLSVPTKKGESADMKNASKLYPAVASRLWKIFKDDDFKVTDTDKNDKPYLRSLTYGDVAILTRSNSGCIKIANALRAKGIPVSVLDEKLDNQAEVKLVLTLMKYIAGIDEKLTIAELRKLVDDESIEQILRSLANGTESADLMALLKSLRSRYANHSVYELVRELIALLDLRHLACKWSFAQKRQANLDILQDMAATFVQKRREASIAEFIQYVPAQKVDIPFDNTGNTVKVLTYHKSKGLQWKMVILDSLHGNSLDEDNFIKKEFCGVTTQQREDSTIQLNMFPPIHGIQKYIDLSQHESSRALYEYLAAKRCAEDLRLLYVGYTRAENYAIRLSFGAVPSKWLENTGICFDASMPQDTIYDDPSITPDIPKEITMLPHTHIANNVERESKYISPSKHSLDADCTVPACTVQHIAENVDITRWDVDTALFGTCVHNYMAIHSCRSGNAASHEQNLARAERIINSFGLAEQLSKEKLVAQADALFAHLVEHYGEIAEIYQELPFTHRKENGQVINGEIDLYVKFKSGEGILVDYKNPLISKDRESDETIIAKAQGYWPQLSAYHQALTTAGMPVNHTFVYYAVLGALVSIG